MAADATRAARLAKVFNGFLHGTRPISSTRDAEHFFEAAQTHASPSECLEVILSSPSGLSAVHKSVCTSAAPQFICSHVLPFLGYLDQPEAKAICEGIFLRQVIVSIVDPPTAWHAILKQYIDGGFADKDMDAFAWLCLQIVLHPGSELAAITSELEVTLKTHPLNRYTNSKAREFGYRIQKILQAKSSSSATATEDMDGPGGRHDNDFADFREISIFPTRDELSSTITPFYRLAKEVANSDQAERTGVHLDNQFRLLREDMLAELRDDIRIATGKKKGKGRAQILGKLFPAGIDTGDEKRGRTCALLLQVGSGLEQLVAKKPHERKSYLKDNKNLLRNESFGALCLHGEILCFAFVVRDIDNLAKDPPIVSLQFCSPDGMGMALSHVHVANNLTFIIIDTPVFAYEPVLERLRDIMELPLEEQLLQMGGDGACQGFAPANHLKVSIQEIRRNSSHGKPLRIGDSSFDLDEAQADALTCALEKPLAVIQGPPGTGKSFVGALAAKMLLQGSKARILVLSYTNHALDQFLEDLLGIGISQEEMTRLGSKSSAVTASLLFRQQSLDNETRLTKAQSTLRYRLKNELVDRRTYIESEFRKLTVYISLENILDHLELSGVDESRFWRAFQIPDETDGFRLAGRKGEVMKRDYLIHLWIQGKGPGKLDKYIAADCRWVWNLGKKERLAQRDVWVGALRGETIESLQSHVRRFNDVQRQIDSLYNESRCSFIKTKSIIGCTTTAAAKYSHLIQAAEPAYILVEEAGEILEAHILTALSPSTQGLILIGDHKQLRPKCKNYALSVEKGSGYDLNRSLFERLILQGHPHTTLRKQHRMVPEISQLIRAMTYPDLQDGEKTLERPLIRGVRGRVVFVNHSHPEDVVNEIGDRQDADQKTSKENKFEAEMVLKTVKYLGQQGYQTSNIVVLTPYLGQLQLLRNMMSKDNDPLLSDLDSHELIRAGVLTAAAAKVNGGQIRLSTIDNYQGEESDIVVVSLTRSNNRGDIGFMKSPERLNVLLSRARNGIILFGNMETFLASPQGKDCWVPFFNLMKENNYLQDSFEVHCEQHPERTSNLSVPQDFDLRCPDGGCSQACGADLSCGLHTCQRRCHRIADHSNITCHQTVTNKCEKLHDYDVTCGDRNARCRTCVQEEADIKRRTKRDYELEKDRLAAQAKYRQEMQETEDEIQHLKRQNKYQRETEDQKRTLEQQRADLAMLKKTKERQDSMKKTQQAAKLQDESKAGPNSSEKAAGEDAAASAEQGSARYEWECLKRDELASNDTLDTLMGMIGLERVKMAFLDIKSTVDTSIRQRVPTENGRFGCSLLGNPGTGKTTVARLYAKFLTSIGVIAGSHFKEVTGSKLANMGVSGCEKLLDDLLNQGGGVVFIDEAYQLSSGNSPGGLAVLDFLLAEVENQRTKICFILAGYTKQMESFFAHNPGILSRFPLEMKFEDYTDDEMLQILKLKIDSKYSGRMQAENGLGGLYCRIVARRLGRGRNKEGFGNARAVENQLDIIYRRQSERLRRERHKRLETDDFLLMQEDLIGPKPSNALSESKAWVKLQELIGLASVKESIKSLVDTLETNYHRELKEEPIVEYSLNRVFLGNPGTGKTTVAKLYGQVLADIGLLSNGEVIVKNPSDFVGAFIGHSEKQTNGILAATVGKVLVIDEAYALYGGHASAGGGHSNSFKDDVVDTIVANVHSTAGDDRCVLLLGYRDQMEEMFQNVNPGFSRRFPLSSAFAFEDFNEPELCSIMDLKLKQQGYGVTDEAKKVALAMLDRARNGPSFGNAGEVDILLNEAKGRHQTRLTLRETMRGSVLEALDFDENYDRLDRADTNVAQLFNDTVGCELLVNILQGYQETARTSTNLGLDPKEHIPFTFIFRGPPGTGKSTTARKMGKVFYDAGFLASAQLHDCSASDLVGQYVGQTGPKVRQLLDKALGSVLLIDEAYRLAEGHFAKEALDELVDAITKERYHKRLIIILAGYEKDINGLLSVNPGLTSRFPEVIDFHSLAPTECFNLLAKRLLKLKTSLTQKGKGSMEADCLETPSAEFRAEVCTLFDQLSSQPSWGSARDVETLAKSVFQTAMRAAAQAETTIITVSEDIVRTALENMAKERKNRSNQPVKPHARSKLAVPRPLYPTAVQQVPPRVTLESARASSTVQHSGVDEPLQHDHAPPPPEELTPKPTLDSNTGSYGTAIRDAGVSDQVWDQLQRDAQAEQQREQDYQAKLRAKREAVDDAIRERILKELMIEEENRKKEAEMKKQLAIQGRCPMGYAWIRQAGGWRCAGGSHFAADTELRE